MKQRPKDAIKDRCDEETELTLIPIIVKASFRCAIFVLYVGATDGY
jgi:hypothetical protein